MTSAQASQLAFSPASTQASPQEDQNATYIADFIEIIDQLVQSPEEQRARLVELADLMAAKDIDKEQEAVVHLYEGDRCVHKIPVASFNPMTVPTGSWNARLYGFDPRKGRRRYIVGAKFGGNDDHAPSPQPMQIAHASGTIQPMPAPAATPQNDIVNRILEAALQKMLTPPAPAAPVQPVDEEAKFDKWLQRAEKFAARLNGTPAPASEDDAEKWAWVGETLRAFVPTVNRLVDAIEKRGAKPAAAANSGAGVKRVDNTADERREADRSATSGGATTPPPDAPSDVEEDDTAEEPGELTPEQQEEAKVFQLCRDTVTFLGQHLSMGDVIAVMIIGHKRGLTDGAIAFKAACVLQQDWDAEDFPTPEDRRGVAKTIGDMHDLVTGAKAEDARKKLAEFAEVPVERIDAIARIVTQLVPRVEVPTKEAGHAESETQSAELDTRGNDGGADAGGHHAPSGDGGSSGVGGDGHGDADASNARMAPQTPPSPAAGAAPANGTTGAPSTPAAPSGPAGGTGTKHRNRNRKPAP